MRFQLSGLNGNQYGYADPNQGVAGMKPVPGTLLSLEHLTSSFPMSFKGYR